ncbi:MAG: TIGR03067 domain-containing protein [Pirellulaceae bacterium]|nr:TIGR03067 domain-containing protein [Pirellulaceae bacterium]
MSLAPLKRVPHLVVCVVLATSCLTVEAQQNAIDNELKLIDGNWRVVQLVENGQSVPEDQMKFVLPGGGIMEMIDETILFKSPIDGNKGARRFRIDPTSYPKKIAIFHRDATTGAGIYKFDQGKMVVCLSKNVSQQVVEFTAAAGSHQTLMILERFEDGSSIPVPGYNAGLPATPPRETSVELIEVKSTPIPPVTTTASNTSVIETAAPGNAPANNTFVGKPVLTDSQVHNLLLGKWRMNDGEGSVDMVFGANGKFQTYRYFQSVQNFQTVFVPTPISSGDWSITNGRLLAKVGSSTRASQINHVFEPAVRSISATDMILEDHFGRVTRAVKIP